MATPFCGSDCVQTAEDKFLTLCNFSAQCVCENQSFIDTWYSCISSCSASDIQTWIQDAQEVCNVYGVSWPYSAVSPATTASTVLVASVTTATRGSTVVVVATSTVTNTPQPASTTISSGFFGAPITSSASAPASTNAFATSPSSSESEPAQPSQSSSGGGLSAGAAAGIAVGAFAMALFALIGLALLWRRRRKNSRAILDEGAPIDEGKRPGGQQGEIGREVKPTTAITATLTSIKNPQELPVGPSMGGPPDVSPVTVPELSHNTRLVPSSPPQPLSPAPEYSEVSAPVPSEIYTANQQIPGYHSVPGAAEVDSRTISPPFMSQPPSELPYSFAIHHELPASPGFSPSTTGPGQEFSSQSNRIPTASYLDASIVASSLAAGTRRRTEAYET